MGLLAYTTARRSSPSTERRLQVGGWGDKADAALRQAVINVKFNNSRNEGFYLKCTRDDVASIIPPGPTFRRLYQAASTLGKAAAAVQVDCVCVVYRCVL